MATFPNVPAAPGVPTLLRSPLSGLNTVSLLVSDLLVLFAQTPVWGVFNSSGQLALKPDTITELGYKQDSAVSDYPQEAGSFASYNKVATPFDIKVRMVKSGDDNERGQFLLAVDTIQADLNLYSVVMPDGTYPSVNMDHYDLTRKPTSGVGMLIIDCWFTEIRISGTSSFQQTAQPAGQNPSSTGTVVPTDYRTPVTVEPL